MLKVKSGVHPRSLTIAAAVINAAIELQLTADMLITSGNDGVHMPKAKHYQNKQSLLPIKKQEKRLIRRV